MSISLCMIVKDEEKTIRNCLDSVKDIVDEIVIIDTGSTDKTKDAISHFSKSAGFSNIKVIDFVWDHDFSSARNESLKHAKNEWVLVLDPDEKIAEKDRKRLVELTRQTSIKAFSLEQRTFLPNNKFRSNWLVRLFMNNQGFTFRNQVHELVENAILEKGEKIQKTDILIEHFGSLKSPEKMERKKEYYGKLLLKQLHGNPKNERYNYQVGMMMYDKKEYDEALKYLEAAAEINPKYMLVHSEIARIYLKKENKEKAIEHYRKSLEMHPENPSPVNNLAVVLMSVGEFKEALKILEAALKKNPKSAPLKINLNEARKNLKN